MMNEANLKQILEMQDDCYQKRIGTVFGIFRIDDIKYNWVTRTQEWTVSCTKCGNSIVVPYSVGRDWQRGKGRNRYKCKHCTELEIQRKKSEKIKKEEKDEHDRKEIIGKIINGWKICSRVGRSNYITLCTKCGLKRNVTYGNIKLGNINQCTHRKDFSDPSYIGKRYGNLTVTGYKHGMFICKCDCGFVKPEKPSLLEIGKVTACGRAECTYHVHNCKKNGKEQDISRINGINSEIEIYNWLKKLGFSVTRTKTSGDFGVDIISDSKKGHVAIQVKNNKKSGSPVGISAVQEVYAGGVYYDCTQFAVVSYTGYTAQAVMFAKKLGVMLLTERCELWVNPVEQKKQENENKYNAKHPEINGVRKTVSEWCRYYGVSYPFVHYRISKLGMSLEEALTAQKITSGRPRKNGVA